MSTFVLLAFKPEQSRVLWAYFSRVVFLSRPVDTFKFVYIYIYVYAIFFRGYRNTKGAKVKLHSKFNILWGHIWYTNPLSFKLISPSMGITVNKHSIMDSAFSFSRSLRLVYGAPWHDFQPTGHVILLIQSPLSWITCESNSHHLDRWWLLL